MHFHFSIRQRLQGLALLAVLAVAVVSGLFFSANRVNQQALQAVFEQDSQTLVHLQRMENLLLEVRFRAAGVLLDQLPVQGSLNHLGESRQELAALFARFGPVARQVFADGEAQELLAQLQAQWPVVDGTLGQLDQAYAAKDNNAITGVLEETWPALVKAVVKPLQSLIPLAQQRSQATYADAVAAGNQRLVVGLACAGVCLVLLLVTVVWTLRAVLSPLAHIEQALQAMAQGNLASTLPRLRQDELGRMVGTLHTMQGELSQLVRQVRDAAQNIKVASAEVASGNADLSQRTEQTAANLQETASSTEQLTGAVAHSAGAARQASERASSAALVAQRGGQAVDAVLQTMQGITQSSRQIADIIGVIDSIAFQTNILALNAAVEAARAGEQGRGFAVVASEVRLLAGRSADAAKQIKQLIDASVAGVETGAGQVQQAASTMAELLAAVTQVTTTIDEVSCAMAEQSQGIGQINSAVTQLDAVTQQNAALVEESSAAANSLQSQAARLAGLVDAFELEPAGAAAPRLAAR